MWSISTGDLPQPALRGQEVSVATWGCFTQVSSSRQWENLKIVELNLGGWCGAHVVAQGGQQRGRHCGKGMGRDKLAFSSPSQSRKTRWEGLS